MGQYFSDLIDVGGALWGFVIIVSLGALFIADLFARRRNAEDEVKRYLSSGWRGITRWKINLVCFVTLFLFDWLYPFVFTWFGKKRFVYPALMSIIGLLFAAFATDDMSGDAGEFVMFGLIPAWLIVHFLGWIHVNLVYSRIVRFLAKYDAPADGLALTSQSTRTR
jgi:hypothetical protein